MKKLVFITAILLIAVTIYAQEIKKADLAGSWYPADRDKLVSMLEGYLNDAKLESIPPNTIAIIVPHAGYIYSGPVAAYAYKAISSLNIETVILVGFSHRRYYDGISVYDRGAFETPLGLLKTDEDLAKKLILSHEKVYFNPEAFRDENSVELQLPFIRYIFKDRDIKIVPIAMGVQSYENAQILGEALYEILKDRDKFLIIASTDMSHFHTYGEANAKDGIAVETLKALDPKALFDKVSLGRCEFCGIGPVVAMMIAAKRLGADSIEILKYANSGDTLGMKNSVVGYLSAAIYKSQKSPVAREKDLGDGIPPREFFIARREKVKSQNLGEKTMLNEEQKKQLLKIARETMETYIKTQKVKDYKIDDPVLNREMGAFVTIHKHGELRGCIGNIIGRGPLYLTVRDMAIESSTADPRFPPVIAAELKDIDIELSVLSELEKITDPSVIEMGKHGVLVRSGFRSGVYLPQVATETGWTREEFMTSLCAHKAGLPPDAWKTGKCEISIFTAEVFGEY